MPDPAITPQDIGIFALEFLEDLEDHAVDGVYSAMLIVADLDEHGDIRIYMRTSGDNTMSNIRVLQEAQYLETKHLTDGED